MAIASVGAQSPKGRDESSDGQGPTFHATEWVLHDAAAGELVCSVTAEISGAAPQVVRITLRRERIATELYPTFADAMVRAMALIEEYLNKGWCLAAAAASSTRSA